MVKSINLDIYVEHREHHGKDFYYPKNLKGLAILAVAGERRKCFTRDDIDLLLKGGFDVHLVKKNEVCPYH